MNTAAGGGPHWGSPSNHHIIPNDNISVQCTMSQAPLSLVEFKTWPLSTSTTGLQSTGTNDDCLTADHQSAGGGSASNFCGLMPIPSFAMRFFKDFQRFCPLLPDLVLQLDSGERVNVHRVLFYCCSAYCRQKLKAQQVPLEKDCWSSSRTNGVSLMHHQIPSPNKFSEFNTCPTSEISLIRVPRVEYDSLRTVVDFVYSGGLIDRVNIESLPKIRFAATLLGIDELVTVCDSLFRLYQQGHRGIAVNNHMNPQSTDFTDHHNHLDSFSSCAPSRNDELCMSPTGRVTADRPDSMSSTPTATNSNCSSTNQFKATPTQHYLCIKQQQKHQQQRLPSVASVLAEISSDNRLKLIGNTGTGTSDESAVYTHIEIKREDDCNTTRSSTHNDEPRKAAASKRCNCNNKSSSKRSHTSSVVSSPNSLVADNSNMVPISSATTKNISSNRFICIIEYMKEDLVMTEKYIYASRLQNFNSLLSTYNVIQCIDNNSMNKAKNISSQKDSTYGSSSCVQQKHRHSLILFSLLAANDNHAATASYQKSLQSSAVQHGQVCKIRSDCRQPSLDSPSQCSSTSTTPLSSVATESQSTSIDNGDSLRVQILSNTIEANLTTTSKGVQRFALLCHLDFSDKNSLYTCCHNVLSNSIKELMHFDRKSDLNLRLDSVFCLKKSSGFKSSFRRETLLTTSECYKALAEYSRPEVGELPLVLLSCNGMLHID
ncbi:hypothetical protein GJ496_010471 [Pomphorhynchus laevis]|nr:hypothetical protein GJ496_010471 [Pomphorhynchus laevis]